MKVGLVTAVYIWTGRSQKDLTLFFDPNGTANFEYQLRPGGYKFVYEDNDNVYQDLIDLTKFTDEEIFQKSLVWDFEIDLYLLLAMQKYSLDWVFDISQHMQSTDITLEY